MNRPLTTALILLCASIANGWLFISKILPIIVSDKPPSYQSTFTSPEQAKTVAWLIELNGTTVGAAVSTIEPTPFSTATVWSNLQLHSLPLSDLLPPWAHALLKVNGTTLRTTIELDVWGCMKIDSRGDLREFDSVVKIPGAQQDVHLHGDIDAEKQVTVSLQSGDLQYETKRHIPNELSIRDELSPQANMPGISQGQRWTVPIYSPLRPSKQPIELIYAHVAGQETLRFESELVTTDIINYRTTPDEHRQPRSRIWVGPHGEVLQHEAIILGKRLLFLRTPESVALSLKNRLEQAKELFTKNKLKHDKHVAIEFTDQTSLDNLTEEPRQR